MEPECLIEGPPADNDYLSLQDFPAYPPIGDNPPGLMPAGPAELDKDASLPFHCNFCMKKYKSQGSLQNHRSLYHRDLIRQKYEQV